VDRHGKALTTVACRQCGIYRTDPLPSIEDLKRFHEMDYRNDYKGVRQPKAKNVYRSARLALTRLRRLRAHLAPQCKVLDEARAQAEFVCALNAAGYKATGIEADPVYAEFARREYGADLRTGGVLEVDIANGSFDAISLFHVLEHQPDPLAVLRRLQNRLLPGGCLILEVPNLDSVHQHPAARFHQAHVVGFTVESLRFAASKAGFQIAEMSIDSFDRNLFARLVKGEATMGAMSLSIHPTPLLSNTLTGLLYYARPATYIRTGLRLLGFAREFLAVSAHTNTKAMIQANART